jgi:deazaflavin-dependent oxidoreductase (nitroreductase family)
LVTTGRRSGLPRQHYLLPIPHEDDLALMASNFGQPGIPAWALNLEADPRATISYGGVTRSVIARPAAPSERGEILSTAARIFPGAGHYEQRLQGRRELPVFVLQPTTD